MEADLLLIPKDAIDLVFSPFDCRRSTCLSHTGLAFAVAEIDFPSPTSAVHQLNDGIFHSLVFHGIYFAQRLRGPKVARSLACARQHTKRISPYVHLCT
jgi:hypothetical protein